jgi:NADH-quinone oxidoreductase subunit E
MAVKAEITQEKIDELMQVIAENKTKKGPLMPTLHEAQRIFGCIPISIQKIISKELGVSVSEINGVVTFYAQFSTEPKGKHIIGICLGTACYVRGAQEIINAVTKDLKVNVGETSEDGQFTVEATRCIGACGLAPVFTVDGHVYGNATVAKAKEALKEFI